MDKESWIKLFYKEKRIKENYIFPKHIDKDYDYKDSLRKFLDNLIRDLEENDFDKNYIIMAKDYKKLFSKVILNYYKGDIIGSYKLINECILKLKNNPILYSKLSKSWSFSYFRNENKEWNEFVFFRSRIGDQTKEFLPNDLKHTPFNMISKIGSYRFSIPGQPCLYLGGSSYVCWLEMNKPQDNEFNCGAVLLKRDYRILNLSFDTSFFVGLINRVREKEWPNIFEGFLLTCATSFCVNEPHRLFKSEYILSQLITLACKMNHIDGISYTSKRISSSIFRNDISMNLALFVQYEKDNKYSTETETNMEFGNPVNYSFFTKLHITSEYTEFKLPYEECPTIKQIGCLEYQIPYKETNFYDFDKYLFQQIKSKRRIIKTVQQ